MGRRGVNSSFKWFLPVFSIRSGGGGGVPPPVGKTLGVRSFYSGDPDVKSEDVSGMITWSFQSVWLCNPRSGRLTCIRRNSREHFSTKPSPCAVPKRQSWAHHSYKLSERSKAMSDLCFSERKKMSVERWANCREKEFAHRSKRLLKLKERAFWEVRSLSDETMLSFRGQYIVKILAA